MSYEMPGFRRSSLAVGAVPAGDYLGEHDLLRVRTDAEKYLVMAALNLPECIAGVGAETSA